MYPLKVVDSLEDYNVFVTVHGGGVTGQADAVALAMSKAIVIHNPLLKKRLSRAECLKTDRRKVERKKPGKLKARRSMTWVKR
jgi:small subunit ribosomal protein S9